MKKITNSEIFRKNVTVQLTNYLKNEKYGENLEKGIFNNTLEVAEEKNIVKKWDNIYFTQIYLDKLKTIMYNLKNPEVANLILEKKIKAHELAYMTHQEMIPDKWNSIIEDLKIKNQNKYTPKIEASTDNFTCYKCKSKECSYYQLQTRSADEPMTTFVTCIKCGTRWKC
jgi:transcription elongation factor S-II